MTRYRGSASVSQPARPGRYGGRHRAVGRASVRLEPSPPTKASVPVKTNRAPAGSKTSGAAEKKKSRKRRKQLPLWQELPLLVLLAFGIALLVRTFLLQAFLIPTGSMENTLAIQDRVLVNKVIYDLRDPHRGEVVVFRGTDSWAPEERPPPPAGIVAKTARTIGGLIGMAEPGEKDFVKRVIGVPGDQVACCDHGKVTVNGHPLDEPYVFENNPLSQRQFGPIVVPPGRLFVMGDHRGLSADSRAYIRDRWSGTISIDDVIGRAFLRVWPVSHWGSLPVPATFDRVPPYRIGKGPPGEDSRTVEPSGEVGGVVLMAVSVRRRTFLGRRLRW